MRRVLFIFFILILVSSVSAVRFDAQIEKTLEKEDYVDVIINLKNQEFKGLSKTSSSSIMQDKVITDVSNVKRRYKTINAFSARISKEEFERLKNNYNIESIEEDKIFEISLSSSIPHINGDIVGNKDLKGKGETVCVLDTGVDYNHVAIKNRLVGQYCYCLLPEGVNPDCCYDGTDEDTDAMDNHGHGTHVSGIIASNDTIYGGVAPESGLAVVKVMNSSGSATGADIIAGIEWCITNRGLYNISVISISIGGGRYYDYCDGSSVASAANIAVDNGLFVSVSSGNYYWSDSLSEPACASKVSSVGNVDNSDNIQSHSNSAFFLDLLAPGTSINSAKLGGGFIPMTGTSMSAPHVAGAAVLLKQYAKLQGYDLTPAEIENTLKNTGKLITDSRNGLDFPRIDLLKAIHSLDIVNPNLNLDSPISKFYNKNIINLNYSAKDLNLDSVWYEFEGVNTSLSDNISLNLDKGYHTLKIYTNDSNNNLNFTSLDFGINIYANQIFPENDTLSDIRDVEFNCSAVTHDLAELSNISLYVKQGEELVLNQTNDVTGIENSTVFLINNIPYNTSLIWSCRTDNTESQFYVTENKTLKIRINYIPSFTGYIKNQSWNEDIPLVLHLDGNFSDKDGNGLTYNSSRVNNISVSFAGSVVTLTPDQDWFGERNITFSVLDKELEIAESNLVNLVVNSMPDCGDGVIEGSEQCEVGNLDGQTCITKGFDKGTLICSSCSFDTSGCSNNVNSPPGSPSGGGGSPTDDEESAPVVEEEEEVSEPVEAGEPAEEVKEPEITGSSIKKVKEESFLKSLWQWIKELFRKIIDFFSSVKFK